MKVVIVEDEFVAAQNLERMIQAVDGNMEIRPCCKVWRSL